ncbi:glucosyltransferase [Candidatus Phycosocius spiralis]|uniref:Glucosyltransferase n=1 Tax=Candidatus Phycosocius spiralis TaxID=2815099 RepID=A0ABQ4PXK9_9PROT|nr:glucosyltransferase [Candidatus Phycosocius spiralis]
MAQQLKEYRAPNPVVEPGPLHLHPWIEASVKGWRPHVLILITLLLCTLPGFFALPPLDRDESRFAQATTQMFETKDFIRIRFQDEPRHKKPVGIHWLQAVSVSLLDGATHRTIQAFRLPSLFGAFFAAICTFQIGALLYNRWVGLIGGLALAGSLLMSTEAGIAKTDACLVGFTTLTYLGLAGLRAKPENKRYIWFFWGGLAMATLIKGPIGLLLILFSGVMLVAWERDLRWVKRAFHWPAILLAAVIVLPWYIAIWQATHGQFFMDAVGQDLAPKLSGQSENKAVPPGAHLLMSPILLWPTSFLIPLAFWVAWTSNRDPRIRFLLAWLVPGWLMFEAAPAKLAHYTLPVHGALVLLGAIGLFMGGWQRPKVRWLGIALLTLGTAVMTSVPYLLGKDVAMLETHFALLCSVVIGCIGMIGLTMVILRPKWAIVGLVAMACITSVTLKGLFVPSISALDLSRRVSAALQREGLHPRLSPGTPGPLIGAGYQEPSLIFLTRSDSALSSVAAAVKAARIGSGIVVNTQPQFKAALTLALAKKGLAPKWRKDVLAGLNYSKGDPVELAIGSVVAAPKPMPVPNRQN